MVRTRILQALAGLLTAVMAGCLGVAAPPATAPAQPAAGPSAPAAQPVSRAPDPPRTLAECRAAAATSPPPAAAPVAPAAGTPADAAVLETKRQLDARMDAAHEAFRCCYDVLAAPASPRRSAHVGLLVKLDHAGKVTSAEIVPAATDVASPEVHTCILETAKQLDYPRPAMDMDVGYQRVFDFEARR